MDAHSDYYEPILRAEKLAEEQAIIELEKEKQDSLPNEPQPQPSSSQDQKWYRSDTTLLGVKILEPI
ncbi:hypothetical protein Fmac_027311 [Flemingia macrophylla]|uniref:GCK domain-containing protein n=1 Tax=Flemingia macrophylla TaxID=520843 RepID=A0ABD1LHC1_9FABA